MEKPTIRPSLPNELGVLVRDQSTNELPLDKRLGIAISMFGELSISDLHEALANMAPVSEEKREQTIELVEHTIDTVEIVNRKCIFGSDFTEEIIELQVRPTVAQARFIAQIFFDSYLSAEHPPDSVKKAWRALNLQFGEAMRRMTDYHNDKDVAEIKISIDAIPALAEAFCHSIILWQMQDLSKTIEEDEAAVDEVMGIIHDGVDKTLNT